MILALLAYVGAALLVSALMFYFIVWHGRDDDV